MAYDLKGGLIMFGVDWDGDGKEDIVDDFITYDLIEEFDESDRKSGSCLMFLVGIGLVIAAPIVAVVNLIA